MVQQPFGLVEVRGWFGPVLVVSLEPDGPLAGSFAGEEAGEPGCPDVRKGAGYGGCGSQCDTRGVGRWGLPRVYGTPWCGRYGNPRLGMALGVRVVVAGQMQWVNAIPGALCVGAPGRSSLVGDVPSVAGESWCVPPEGVIKLVMCGVELFRNHAGRSSPRDAQ